MAVHNDGPGWEQVVAAWLSAQQVGEDRCPIPGPATQETITDAEKRLGVAMPTVLVELYRVADGLPELGGDDYGIRGCAELDWFRDAEVELIEIWDDIDRDGGSLTEAIDLMRAGLAVSKGGDEHRLLLVPNGTGAGDWQLYRQSNDGSGVTPRGSLVSEYLELARWRHVNRTG